MTTDLVGKPHPQQFKQETSMTSRFICKSIGGVAAALALTAPAQAQWVALPTSGTPILQTINPKVALSPQPTSCTNNPGGSGPTGDQSPVEQQSASSTVGKFTGLPGSAGLTGFASTPVASASYPLITGSGSKYVGDLYDRVYRSGSGTNTYSGNVYVFATRVILNATPANPNGTSFEVNDIFRTVPSTISVDAAYYAGTSGTSIDTGLANKVLEYAGRTANGLNQTIARDNTKVAFRADTNANDPERCEPYSKSSPIGPWVYVRMTCPGGVETGAGNSTLIAFKTKVRQGGEEAQPVVSISTSGFLCKL